ncbi:hypothetical protein [Niveibacterium microcysteis]|uniref:Uncharacterized protein n=1 Tax=Niveibacterium microcysteis TaxID=2811415 RepID=A0ABX7M3L8_9RHOO|nr:hypothetical protein [Niveibacterium microcysteis]QSI76344.1 hypothetical protein JY500_18030 [Niveibacterium microcysteis]
MAARNAAVVVEDALVDDFAELGTGNTTGCTPNAGCNQRTNETACPHARWANDGADRHACASTRQHASGAAYGATGKTDSTANTACAIERDDSLRETDWTHCMHINSPEDGLISEGEIALRATPPSASAELYVAENIWNHDTPTHRGISFRRAPEQDRQESSTV